MSSVFQRTEIYVYPEGDDRPYLSEDWVQLQDAVLSLDGESPDTKTETEVEDAQICWANARVLKLAPKPEGKRPVALKVFAVSKIVLPSEDDAVADDTLIGYSA